MVSRPEVDAAKCPAADVKAEVAVAGIDEDAAGRELCDAGIGKG